MVISDSVIRLIDGVIKEESYKNESFQNNLLDYPTYTKPYEYRGQKVPDVLISGDHAKIALWRKQMQEERTKKRREDLLRRDENE